MNIRPIHNTNRHDQMQPLQRGIPVYRARDRKEDAPPVGGASSIACAIGVMTEAIAYNVANGMHSANRTLWRLMLGIGIGAFLLGMLLMRTIDRELSPLPQQQQMGREQNR
jgi:hypothetical protein